MVRSPRLSKRPYLIFCTVATRKEARAIAKSLVQKRLAACVNIIPELESIFRWQGKLNHAKEFLLLIKTEFRCLGEIKQTIRKIHSYQVPEIIGLPIHWGHQPYLQWISDSISKR